MLRFSAAVVCAAGLGVLLPAAATPDSSRVAAVLSEAGYARDGVAFLMKRVGSGEEAARLNAESLMVPASVAKTVTAAAAFDLLGYDYVFGTGVFLGGALDADSGVVRGNLYVRGSGDPGLLAERVWLFGQHLLNRGVRRVAGDVVLDGTLFDSTTVGPGFGEDNSSRAYEAPVAALSASFSSVEIHLWPAATPGAPVQVRVFPEHAGMSVRNAARTVAPGEANRGVSARTEPRNGGTIVVVEGEMAVGADSRVVYRKVWQATEGFGRVLQWVFGECGIALDGGVREGVVPDSVAQAGPWYEFESLPLTAYVGYMFKYSNNVTAEQLFRTMASRRTGVGSWDSGAAVLRRWWQSAGLPGPLQLVNGSGMGSRNRISAEQEVALLEHVYDQKGFFADYLAALSVAGVDGTLKDRFTRSPLRGRLRAKTGTLNNQGVSSLAGYVYRGNDLWAFAIFINDASHGQFDHWVLQERLLEAVVGDSR